MTDQNRFRLTASNIAEKRTIIHTLILDTDSAKAELASMKDFYLNESFLVDENVPKEILLCEYWKAKEIIHHLSRFAGSLCETLDRLMDQIEDSWESEEEIYKRIYEADNYCNKVIEAKNNLEEELSELEQQNKAISETLEEVKFELSQTKIEQTSWKTLPEKEPMVRVKKGCVFPGSEVCIKNTEVTKLQKKLEKSLRMYENEIKGLKLSLNVKQSLNRELMKKLELKETECELALLLLEENRKANHLEDNAKQSYQSKRQLKLRQVTASTLEDESDIKMLISTPKIQERKQNTMEKYSNNDSESPCPSPRVFEDGNEYQPTHLGAASHLKQNLEQDLRNAIGNSNIDTMFDHRWTENNIYVNENWENVKLTVKEPELSNETIDERHNTSLVKSLYVETTNQEIQTDCSLGEGYLTTRKTLTLENMLSTQIKIEKREPMISIKRLLNMTAYPVKRVSLFYTAFLKLEKWVVKDRIKKKMMSQYRC